nr:MAG TPA: hypothetical protein [Caudoviricetes sp.]
MTLFFLFLQRSRSSLKTRHAFEPSIWKKPHLKR